MSSQYWKSKAAGICYICRERPLWGTHATCDVCAKAQREKQRARVVQALARRQCRKCFHEPQAPGQTLCAGCLARNKDLQDPSRREEAVQQRPLRTWVEGHKKPRWARRRSSGDGQGRLL